MTPTAVLRQRLLDFPAVTEITREIYVMVGQQKPAFITIACTEEPAQSVGMIGGAALTARITAWSADYDQAHDLAAAIRAAMYGVSLDGEGVSLDGIRCTIGPRDTFVEMKSGDIYFAIENTFTATARRTS